MPLKQWWWFEGKESISLDEAANWIRENDVETVKSAISSMACRGKVDENYLMKMVYSSSLSLRLRNHGLLSDVDYRSMFSYRVEVTKITWSLWTNEAVRKVKDLGREWVSLGCGTGWVERLLHENGVDVIAIDLYPSKNSFFEFGSGRFLRYGGERAQKSFKDRDVLIVWPGYGATWPVKVAKKMGTGQYLVYVGEKGGCNATEDFFDCLDADFKEVDEINLINWECINDYLTIYRRKTDAA